MKRLTLFAVLAASLLAWAAPVLAWTPYGSPWRTCMRYGGRDSVLMGTTSFGMYYLDIYSMTMDRFSSDSVHYSRRDTTSAATWSAIVRFRITSERDFDVIGTVLADSLWSPWAPRLKMGVLGDSNSTRLDTTSTGYAGYPAAHPVDGVMPALADSVSGTMAVPGSGEIEVFFNKYNRHFIIPINIPFAMNPAAVWVRIRPGGHNDAKFTYYFRCILRGAR